MLKINIKLVDEKEKFEKIKLVKPNIIFNRADIKFEGNFELLEIEYKSEFRYVAIHINPNCCYLGVYMMDIDKKVFDSIVAFIHKKFRISRFYILQSHNGNRQVKKTIHSLLELPDTQEEFDSRFSSKTRYNRKRELKKLLDKYNCVFKHYNKSEITEDLYKQFLELKRVKYENAYSNNSPKEMFSDSYHITDIYTLEINNKIEAFNLYSMIDNEEIYIVNLSNNLEYSKYGIGIMLFYYAIYDFIKRGVKRIYLGGGHYDYKKNSKSIVTNTFEGYFEYYSFLEKLFSYQTIFIDGRERRYIFILGLKFKLRQNEIDTSNYKEYYEKIRLEKIIKKYARKNKNKKIVIYGAGQMSKILFENYDLSALNIVGIVDKSFETNKPDNFYGYPCLTPSELEVYDFDNMIIMLFRYGDIIGSLKKRFPKKNIKAIIK